MSNCVFGWPIFSDESVLYTPTYSGGSWETTLPLDNIADRRLDKVARSTDATATNTVFEVDLGVAREVGLIAVILPNLSSAGTVRVKGSSTEGDFSSPVYDSTAITPYPSGATAETLGALSPTFVAVPSSGQTARYWQVQITDTGNSDGYIDVARLVIAKAWQPSINMSAGAVLGLESETSRRVTDGGSAVYNDRPRRRLLDFSIALLPDDESMEDAWDMQRIAGTSGQMFFVMDPADTGFMLLRRSFLCVLRALSGVEFTHYDMNTVGFRLTEEL